MVKKVIRKTILDGDLDKFFVKKRDPFALPITSQPANVFVPNKTVIDESRIRPGVLPALPIAERPQETFNPSKSEIDTGKLKAEVLAPLPVAERPQETYQPVKTEVDIPKKESLNPLPVTERPTEVFNPVRQEIRAEVLKSEKLDPLPIAEIKEETGTVPKNKEIYLKDKVSLSNPTSEKEGLGMPTSMESEFNALNKENVLQRSKKTYDCIVDIAGYGDFLYLYDAIKAGATSIFVRDGNYEERGSIIPLANTTIVGESRLGTIINFVGNTITLSSNDVTFRHCTLQSTAITNFITQTASCCFDDVLIDWDTSVASTYAIYSNATALARITMSNVYFNCPNIATAYGLYINGGSYGILVAHNLFFYGEGANAVAMKIVSSTYNHIITNLYMDGTFSTTDTVVLNITNISNVLGRSIDFELTCLYKCEVSNVYMVGSNSNMEIYNDSNLLINIQTANMEMSGSASHNNQITNGRIYVLTLNSGAYYNSFIQCMVQTVTDNSGKPNEFMDCHPLNTSFNLLPSDYKTKYVKNTSGGDLVAGNLVTLKAVAGGNEITTTTTQGDDLVLGMLAEDIANNGYGMVQTLGKTTLLKVDGTTDIAIGDFIGTFTTAGIGMKCSAGDMAIAIALEAYTTDDSAGVIDALLITPRKI